MVRRPPILVTGSKKGRSFGSVPFSRVCFCGHHLLTSSDIKQSQRGSNPCSHLERATGPRLTTAEAGQSCSLTGNCSLSAPTHSSVGWQIVGRNAASPVSAG